MKRLFAWLTAPAVLGPVLRILLAVGAAALANLPAEAVAAVAAAVAVPK